MSTVDAQRELVLFEVADRVATVTLNRPERRNAISAALARAITEAMLQAEQRDDVDVVVLTGSGPAFCAGLDLVELGDTGDNLAPHGVTTGPWSPGGGTWLPMTKPVIGAINGPAVTGGLELALQCDILIAGERAAFADTHARVGVFPGGGMIALLPRAVGPRSALAMSLSGNFIDAHTALRMGLVVDVVPDDQLLAAAHRLAADIVSAEQPLVRAILDTYRRTADLGRAEAIAAEAAAAADWNARIDFAGVRARRAGVIARGRSQHRPT